MEELIIDGHHAGRQSQARVTIVGVPNRPGLAAQVFREMAEAGIFVDMIVQSHEGRQGQTNVSFTVPARRPRQEPLTWPNRLAEEFGSRSVQARPKVAKLSVFGIGMRSHTGVATRMFQRWPTRRSTST